MVLSATVLGTPYDTETARHYIKPYTKATANDVIAAGDVLGVNNLGQVVPNPAGQKAENWVIAHEASLAGATSLLCIGPGGTGFVTTNEAVYVGNELMLGTGAGNEKKVKKLVLPGTWAADLLQLVVGEVVYIENKSGITKTNTIGLCAIGDIIAIRVKGDVGYHE